MALSFHKNEAFMKTACIDIGGTYIKMAILEEGHLFSRREIPTNASAGAERMLQAVESLIRSMPGVQCVGISTAGEADPHTGCIRFSCNIPHYTGMNPKQCLEQRLHLPVAIENDVCWAAV